MGNTFSMTVFVAVSTSPYGGCVGDFYEEGSTKYLHKTITIKSLGQALTLVTIGHHKK